MIFVGVLKLASTPAFPLFVQNLGARQSELAFGKKLLAAFIFFIFPIVYLP